ncbi:hypothetical protein HZA45_02285 [Candidatus Peregrinibacteria bacterium]|nr:hypothetical protein [Candidatus Peregrinibacteria bacterium]
MSIRREGQEENEEDKENEKRDEKILRGGAPPARGGSVSGNAQPAANFSEFILSAGSKGYFLFFGREKKVRAGGNIPKPKIDS